MKSIEALTVGPIVGHTGVDQVRIFGRAVYQALASGQPKRVFGVARVRRKGGAYGAPHIIKMNPNFDMTGVAVFQGLKPDTAYSFQMGWFFSDKELHELRSTGKWRWKNASRGVFKTASDDAQAPRSFVFGSCRYFLRLWGGSFFDNRGDKTFRSILRQIEGGRPLDSLLMIGDQVYADDLNVVGADVTVEQYLTRYRDVFSQPHIRKLMSQVSTYMTLDDHEIEDNWPANATARDWMVKFPHALHAYRIYQLSHSPVLPVDEEGKFTETFRKNHHQFQNGCCDYFVTDTRTERNLKKRWMIGAKQMQSLLDWLEDGSGRIKFVVTSVPFFPDYKDYNSDKWSGTIGQRDRIIAHIRSKQIQKVVFLSGDVHCSMAAELDIAQDGEAPLKIHSIVSSAFHWPFVHESREDFQLTGALDVSNGERYTLGRVSNIYRGDNFTRVSASPGGIEVEVYGRKGGLKHSFDFRF